MTKALAITAGLAASAGLVVTQNFVLLLRFWWWRNRTAFHLSAPAPSRGTLSSTLFYRQWWSETKECSLNFWNIAKYLVTAVFLTRILKCKIFGDFSFLDTKTELLNVNERKFFLTFLYDRISCKRLLFSDMKYFFLKLIWK